MTALPTRAEIEGALDAIVADALARHAIDREAAALDIRPYGRAIGDAVDRVGVGQRMHHDAGGRRCFEMVETRDGDWRAACARHVDDILRDTVRLEARRAAFDPERTLAVPPRWAWDVNPAAAGILSRYRRIPALDGSHRLDGEFGRMVDLGEAPGVDHALIAYGDGVVTLVEAKLPGGATVHTEEARLVVRTRGRLPASIETSLRGRPASDVAAQFGGHARARQATVTAVRSTGDGHEIVLRDVLAPWDARRRGGEPWRRTSIIPRRERTGASDHQGIQGANP